MNREIRTITQQVYRSLDEVEQRAVRVLAARGECRILEESGTVAK